MLLSSPSRVPTLRLGRYLLHATVSYFPPIGPSSFFQHHRHKNATPTPRLNLFGFVICFSLLSVTHLLLDLFLSIVVHRLGRTGPIEICGDGRTAPTSKGTPPKPKSLQVAAAASSRTTITTPSLTTVDNNIDDTIKSLSARRLFCRASSRSTIRLKTGESRTGLDQIDRIDRRGGTCFSHHTTLPRTLTRRSRDDEWR